MDDSNRIAIGIDVSDHTAQVCVLGRSGILDEFRIALDEPSLRRCVPFVEPERGVVVIETGGRAAWMKRVFTKLGMRCVVADARKLAAISTSPTKTDRNDARVLARLGLADELMGAGGPDAERLLHDTYVRPPELQRIYERLRVRDQLVTRRGDFIRQVRSIVKGTGSTLRGGTADAFHLRREEVGDDVRDVVDPLFDVIASCTEAIDRIDARLTEIAKGIPAVERLLAVSGVGPITSLAFYAVIGDPARFSNIRDVGAYLGMVVRRDQSGKLDPALGISKCGNGFMRRLLVQCAAYILGPFGKDCALRAWGLKYIAEKGERSKKKARVAVARKLAVQLTSIWKNEQAWRPFPDEPAAAEVPSATVGRDDCAEPSEPHELAIREIAASPTACTQPCARPDGARTDESAESRRDTATAGSRKRAPKAPARYTRTRTATAEGERGCPPPGARVAPAPGPGTPALPRAHMDAPQERAGGLSTDIGVGPQPPPARRRARTQKGRGRALDEGAAS
jgi:transposase